MLGALPHVAVGQQHGQPSLPQSLDHHLRAAHEFHELRLPLHQRIGVLQRVTHLEAQHAKLRQDGDLGLYVCLFRHQLKKDVKVS